MKIFLVILLFISSIASAKEVTVTGSGSTYDRALANAKMLALENVTGTFIIGEKEYRDKEFRESMEQYNGGIIKSFRVQGYKEFPHHIEVTITADVVEKKDNRIEGKNKQSFNIEFDEHEQRRVVVDKLDNVNNMIAIEIQKPTYEVDRHSSIISIDMSMKMQPKWVSDMQSFTDVIGEDGKTSNNAYSSIHGGVVSSMLGSNPIGAVMLGVLAAPAPKQKSEQTMVCFAKVRGSFLNCKNIGVSFVKIPKYPQLVVEVISDGVKYTVYKQRLDMKMYEFVHPGEYRNHYFFKSYKEEFHQPAWVIYTGEKEERVLRFKLDNRIAKDVQNVRVYLK
jgi:hypothetical protein